MKQVDSIEEPVEEPVEELPEFNVPKIVEEHKFLAFICMRDSPQANLGLDELEEEMRAASLEGWRTRQIILVSNGPEYPPTGLVVLNRLVPEKDGKPMFEIHRSGPE